LAVRRVGFTTLVPGLDVIAFHFIQLKLLLTLHADSLLPLVCFPLHIVGERADVQVSFIPIQHIRVDSRFLCTSSSCINFATRETFTVEMVRECVKFRGELEIAPLAKLIRDKIGCERARSYELVHEGHTRVGRVIVTGSNMTAVFSFSDAVCAPEHHRLQMRTTAG
jgi:hypothetical protein